jgi:nitroreductase
MDFLEVVSTQRAIRRFTAEPVTHEVIRQILEAAVRAPSGGNRQPWRFIVIRDAVIKKQLGVLYAECSEELIAKTPFYAKALSDPAADPAAAKMMKSSRYLVEHFDEVPVFIVACMLGDGPPLAFVQGASIYPAVQNICLAARNFGLGTTITTIHRYRHEEIRRLLQMPSEAEIAAIIPLGYPAGTFGSGPRRPVSEVTYLEKWGKSWTNV